MMESNKIREIWIIEDDEIDLMSYERVLANIPSEKKIRLFRYAKDAMIVLQETHSPPMLIFLDLNLPQSSGLDFLKFARSLDFDRHIAIIIISTSMNNLEIKKAYDLGATSYFSKPIDHVNFEIVIKQICLYFSSPLLMR